MGRAAECEEAARRERTAEYERAAERERAAQGVETALRERIFRAVEALEQPMITSIRELVQIDSVEQPAEADAPFGPGVRAALHRALSLSRELGFETVNLDNYIGYARYGQGQDYVCAIGHLDVVPPGDGWKQPPFNGHMENGVLYGRGVLDNKGPVLACLYGLAALKELKLPLKRQVRIIFGCDEETGFKDLAYYLEREKPPAYGFTPDCKYPVVYGERGRAVIRAVGSSGELERFFHFVNQYFIGAKNSGDRLGIDISHPEYGMMEMRSYRLGTGAEETGRRGASFSRPLSAIPGESPSGKSLNGSAQRRRPGGLRCASYRITTRWPLTRTVPWFRPCRNATSW
ncbi:dipeptidase PepV [[Clostridium] asparagiforme DSM 15981]|uniref:Dipeptidase PepV n=1 Tax=[Clostridium] asparagiforme DSM 15981 TaxID=518636 RepID=C0D9V0_9FIRM|nr:Sapep family Mn(2+)-dependent dipeptidase [Enterocloster asparagiformis]EEG51895.1 dipeptidase PepV [[Clostridium] asparagiforme DSM 15981]